MITTQITGRPIFGNNPVGFAPITPLNNGGNQFFMTHNKDVEFDYNDLAWDPLGQVPTNKQAFLQMVQDFFDVTYLPTILTDATKDYDVEITVNAVRLDFEATIPGVTDRSIWSQRTWKWYVRCSMRINVI